MIKKLLLIIVAALSVQFVSAQIVVQRDYIGSTATNSVKGTNDGISTFAYKFGVKAGLNMSSMSNSMDNIDPGFSMGMGFRLGGFANLRWGQRTENSLPGTGWFGLQPEVMYSMMQFGTDTDAIQMHSVQVPVMLKIYPTTELSFEVGPEFTYIMSTSPDNMAVDGAQIKVGDIKGMTMGIGVGLSYEMEMGLAIGARYGYGFTEMAKNLPWKNSNIQVTVGWMF